jgi:quercetin dioxygenase-like cupin family protein
MMRPEILFHEAADVFTVETHAPAGWVLGQHEHSHDHLSFLASGTCDVDVEGDVRTLTGPCMLTIKAHKRHTVRALTPIVWLCL